MRAMKTTHEWDGILDFHGDFLYKPMCILLIIQNIIHVNFSYMVQANNNLLWYLG
jgi:hypothetical protein